MQQLLFWWRESVFASQNCQIAKRFLIPAIEASSSLWRGILCARVMAIIKLSSIGEWRNNRADDFMSERWLVRSFSFSSPQSILLLLLNFFFFSMSSSRARCMCIPFVCAALTLTVCVNVLSTSWFGEREREMLLISLHQKKKKRRRREDQ